MHNTRIQIIVQNKTLTDDVINGVRSTVCSCQTFQGDRNGGLLQVGCLYAWNMQNEQSKDILESCFMHLSAFELILLQTNAWIIFSLLFVVTWPLDPISKGIIKHLYPELSMSALRDVYFVVLLCCAAYMFLPKLTS